MANQECISAVAREHGIAESKVAEVVDQIDETTNQNPSISREDLVLKMRERMVDDEAKRLTVKRIQAERVSDSKQNIDARIKAQALAHGVKYDENGVPTASGKVYGVNPVDTFRNLFHGGTRGIFASRDSIFADYEAIHKGFNAPLTHAWMMDKDVNDTIQTLTSVKASRQQIDSIATNVYKAMNGEDTTGISAGEAKLAEIAKNNFEVIRREAGTLGARINEKSNGIAMMFDFESVIKKSKEEFVSDLMAMTDMTRSYAGKFNNEKAYRKTLGYLYDSMTKNLDHATQKLTMDAYRQRGLGFSQLENAYNLVPASAESHMDFMRTYGRDNEIHNEMQYVNTLAARQISLMKRLGPDIQRGFDDILDHMERGINDGKYYFESTAEKEKALHEIRTSRLFDSRMSEAAISMLSDVDSKFAVFAGRDYRFLNELKRAADGNHSKEFASKAIKFINDNKLLYPDDSSGAKAKANMLAKLQDIVDREVNTRNLDSSLVRAFVETAGETYHTTNKERAELLGSIRAVKNMAMYGLSSAAVWAGDTVTSTLSLVFKDPSWAKAINTQIDSWRASLRSTPDEVDRMTGYLSTSLLDMLGSHMARGSFDEPGKIAKMQSTYFWMNGMKWVTRKGQQALARSNMRYLGEFAEKDFFDLSNRAQNMLLQQGIGARKWEVLRHAVSEINGVKYMTPESVNSITSAALEAKLTGYNPDTKIPDQFRQFGDVFSVIDNEFLRKQHEYLKDTDSLRRELINDIYRVINDEVRFGVLDVEAKTRYHMLRGTNPGTLKGDILRFMGMAKSAPVAVVDRVMGRFFMGGDFRETQGVMSLPFGSKVNTMDLAKFISGAIVAGYAAQTAQDLLSGRTPRNPFSAETIMDSLTKSGALGLYMDVVNGMAAGYDSNFVAKLASVAGGPVASDVVNLTTKVLPDYVTGETEKANYGMFKIGVNNLPFANLAFNKLALDYLVLWNIAEHVSPGAYDRRKAWYEREKGSTYFASPSELF